MKQIWLNVDDADMSILLDALEADGLQVRRCLQESADLEQTLRHAQGCMAVVSGGERWDEAALARAHGLELIVRYGSGVDNIDIEAATRRGIAVSAATGMNARAVAEAALMHILSGLRHFERSLGDVRRPPDQRCSAAGRELYGKTVGILGAGRIGRYLIEYLQPFHTKIYAYDVFQNPDLVRELGVEFLPTVEDVLARCDVVSIHMPATTATVGLFSRDLFAKMKPGALLVNTSRGAVIREADLADALRSGHLRYACVDVVCDEPIRPDNPLLALDNLSVTPHMAANTEEAEVRTQHMIAEIVHQYLCGAPVHILNPDYVRYRCEAGCTGKFNR